MKRKWFKEAIMKRPPYTLGGWKKDLPQKERISLAYHSRPSSWSKRRKILSSARGLLALSNVTKDKETKRKARADAQYLFSLLKNKH